MDSLTITILSIVVVTFLSAFIKGRKKDRCLKKIDGFFVNIYNAKEKIIWGRAEIESNSIVVDFEENLNQPNKKFLLYKNEFKNMQIIVRTHKSFNPTQISKRERMLKSVLKPGFITKIKRRFRNVFATAKDAVNEIVNLLLSKTMGSVKSISSQSKQIDRLKEDSIENLSSNAYEPIWEKYIGKTVEVEVFDDEDLTVTGVLGEYSQAYIFLYNAAISNTIENEPLDLIISRAYGTIRHVL